MAASERFIPRGVIPAVLLPFDSDLQIDDPAYRSHLRDVAAVDGISALTINAHASEVHALSFDEQKRVLDITLDEVGGRIPASFSPRGYSLLFREGTEDKIERESGTLSPKRLVRICQGYPTLSSLLL